MKTKPVQLYALTTSGEIKTLIFEVDGAKFITTHGRLDGKMMTTFKVCKPMNEGKSNERDAHAQAIFEMNAKAVKKMKEGYDTKIPKVGGVVKNAKVDLKNLPQAFCPSKPISKCPAKVESGKDTYGQRKFNGNCLILTKMKVFSRRMKDLTDALGDIPLVKDTMKKMKSGDMLNTEITYFDKKGKESNRVVGSLVRTKDADEALAKFNEYSKVGTFRINVFDILFEDYEFVGGEDYLDRHATLTARKSFYVPELYMDWKKMIPTAKKEGWEGFVLRVKGDSAVTYTVNGKADRAGAYKYKFMKEGDFVVSEVEYGEAGRHATVYAKFKIGQYDDNGELLDCGWAGPGTLTHEELVQYTMEINSQKKMKLPFVVEIEFRDWQEDSTKLEHPVIQRVRFDKPTDECIYEG